MQEEGLLSLLKKGVEFLGHSLFEYGKYYVYEQSIKERDEAAFLPKIRDYTVHVVNNNREADELEAKGFKFRSFSMNTRSYLDKGAIAVCIFVGQELAHIGWIALTEEAKKEFDYIPFPIDFTKREAAAGGAFTNPKYRGKGLMEYGILSRHDFLRGIGIKTTRYTVKTNNIASQRAVAKFGAKAISIGRYIRILWWHSWKQTPLPPIKVSKAPE